MTKFELIDKLTAIDGNPQVIVDCDGRLSSDIEPELRTVDGPLINSIIALDSDVDPMPNLGDVIILL